MVGWKRIVTTVGERIGKTELTPAQGGSADAVAMATISLADFGSMPVNTTHVLSSGVAGPMVVRLSGIQPVILSALFFYMFTYFLQSVASLPPSAREGKRGEHGDDGHDQSGEGETKDERHWMSLLGPT